MIGYTKTPPTTQGWYWAVPMFPEDAYPEIIVVCCDDGRWSYGEPGQGPGAYKLYSNDPVTTPDHRDALIGCFLALDNLVFQMKQGTGPSRQKARETAEAILRDAIDRGLEV